MKTTRILLITSILAGLTAISASARGPGGGSGNCQNGSGQRDPSLCDGSGRGQGTPLRDGSGKAAADRGNPNSNGTPLKDGSGKASARGNGAKDGTGNNANCPNIAPKS